MMEGGVGGGGVALSWDYKGLRCCEGENFNNLV